MLERCQQLIVVPLVQADGWLVQNIQHPHQGGTDLGCQPDALAFAAGQGAGGPGEGQITQSHVRQELEPGLDLLDDLLGDHGHIAFQLKIFHKFQAVPDAHAAEVHNADAAHCHRPGHVRQPVPAALGAGGGGHALLQFLPGGIGLGLLIAPGDIIENPLEGLLQHSHAVSPVVGHVQLFALGAVENHIHHVSAQFFYRRGQGEMILLGQGFKIHPENGIRPGALPAGSLNGPVKDGLTFVRDYQILVGNQPETQAGTAWAGPAGIVEGEHPRFQFCQTDAAVLAGIVLGKAQLLPAAGQLDGH